jgi:hypothetical protein
VKQRQASRGSVIIQRSSFDRPQLRKQLFNSCSFGGILLAGAVSWIAGCANVTFHSDAALTQRTGLKFYTAKPYLLIGPTGNKDAPVKAEIISLSDLEHPTYAIYHPGWGSHNFTLAVGSNGTLSSYGQTADSKGPETITALTGALTSVATLASPLKAAAPLYAPSPNLYIDGAINELSSIGKMPPDKNHVVESKAKAADEIVRDLREWLQAPNGAKKLTAISNKIDEARIKDAAGTELATAINSHFDQAKVNIGDAITLLQEPTPVPSPFQLFEIRMEAGHTTLVPADVRLAQAAIQGWSK